MWTRWRTNCGDVVTKDMEKVKGLEDSSTLAFTGTVSSWLPCAKQWGLVPQSIIHTVEDRAGDHGSRLGIFKSMGPHGIYL